MSVYGKMKHSLKNLYSQRVEKKRVLAQVALANRMIEECHEKIPELSEAQVREIKAYWKQYGIDVTPEWHKLYYGLTGIEDPRFVPNRVFHRQIKGKVNDEEFAPIWSDKAYLDRIVFDAETPRNVLRNVDGHLLDESCHIIHKSDAEQILGKYNRLVIKPTIFTNTGRGVQLLHAPFDLEAIDRAYRSNYVFQIPLKQHPEMDKLNASSVNTVRFNSVLLDDGAHIISAFTKVGQAGEFADNSGHDRYFIGITPEGRYAQYAIDHQLHKYKSIPSGFDFPGAQVPFFRECCREVEKAHECVPHFGFAFWDVCINSEGSPVIVEMNLRYPNSKIPQAACGPFMGSYTDRIMEYILRNEGRFIHEKDD